MKTNMIEIFCKNNNQTRKFPAGISLLEIYKEFDLNLENGVLAARANNKVKNLKFCVYKPKTVEFFGIEAASGMRCFVRSLCFVLYKAVHDLYPDVTLRMEHPISNGYYCTMQGLEKPLSEADVNTIKEKMHEFIIRDIPFSMNEITTDKAVSIFKANHANDKVKLLESFGELYTPIYELEGLHDYYYGSLVPSTGFLTIFDLKLFNDGILLQVPDKKNPKEVEKFELQPKLFETFAEHNRWNKILGLENVGDLNFAIKREKNASTLIKVAEALQDKKIAQIADMISDRPDAKIILVSGPSSSGKTTFSKKLSVQLYVNALKPIALSLDDYFVPREMTPLDENGNYDFESLYALDLELFNTQLKQLLNGEEVELPTFDFGSGSRVYKGNKAKLDKDNILIIEGIHALNPNLTMQIPDKNKFKIYVSALTTISLDNHNWIPTTDNRLIRRIVRDYKYRGYSAEDTINRWDSVRDGEAKWIFPYQENADVMFNSALLFELAVLKKHAEPILLEVPQTSPAYSEAYRLLKFLRYFTPIPDSEVPFTSLLREFLGGSTFKY
jgi:uridine kinase